MSDVDVLAARYGVPSRGRRRLLLVVVAVVVLAFGGWLGWAVWSQARPVVASGELTFEVVDDHLVRAAFVVDLRDADVVAFCRLRAYAEDHTLVGELGFPAEPGAGGRVEQEVATDRRATSVELIGCTAPGQSRPR